MRRLSVIIALLLTFVVSPYAQQKKSTRKSNRVSVKIQKGNKRPSRSKTTSLSVKSLQNRRQQLQRQIREQEKALRNNQHDVKLHLQNLLSINSDIESHKRTLDTIQNDISSLNGNIDVMQGRLNVLELELKERKQRYCRSMQYMYKHRSVQNKLLFIFSAKNFAQMYRRMRFVREYAAYQKAQGEMVLDKEDEVQSKQNQLLHVRGHKNQLLYKGKIEHRALQGKQVEQQVEVDNLKKKQKTMQQVLEQQRRQDAALNAKIDYLIAQEVAKAKARAAAESQRRAAAEARRKHNEEVARLKAAAAAQERENARRIAAAKENEARLKTEARNAARKSQAEKAAAEQAAREAEMARASAEKKAETDRVKADKDIAETNDRKVETVFTNSEDRRISGGFESNRGRLPMPITGPYRVVSHFGQYNVSGLSGVTLDNKGINIQGHSGARARAVFDGEVSAVFSFGGTMVVMLRHGTYISVYCNLSSVSVGRGQKVHTRQVIGSVGSDNILQFQLRRETAKLNPESWLGR
jgi:septal ring factor EnvC (AmiA/AmiB activator)